MAQKEAAEQFWDFALSVYGQDTARDAFLRLQNQDGADVPLMLWCLWSAQDGRAVSRTVMAEAVSFSAAWRAAVVDPLRSARTGLKARVSGVPSALSEDARTQIAQTEQALERVQMTHLAGLPSACKPTEAAAIIALYADVAGLDLTAEDVEAVVASLVAPAQRA